LGWAGLATGEVTVEERRRGAAVYEARCRGMEERRLEEGVGRKREKERAQERNGREGENEDRGCGLGPSQ
jgi:hypothetical protein